MHIQSPTQTLLKCEGGFFSKIKAALFVKSVKRQTYIQKQKIVNPQNKKCKNVGVGFSNGANQKTSWTHEEHRKNSRATPIWGFIFQTQ